MRRAKRATMHEGGSHGEIVRDARVATWFAAGALGALATVRPQIARAIAFALVGTIGIAHGATDDALLHRLGYPPRGGRLALSAAYGALAVATFVAARRAPKIASRALFAVSWLHFGSGDAAFARACGSRLAMAPETVLRGAIPLCIAGSGARSRAVAAVAAVAALRHGARGDRASALDLALPAALLIAAPARLGFGIYFGAWHAIRHTALLLERDARGGTPVARALRFARESIGNVAIALATAAVAFALSPKIAPRDAAVDRDDVFGALILAITVPHQIAVWLFERRSAA